MTDLVIEQHKKLIRENIGSARVFPEDAMKSLMRGQSIPVPAGLPCTSLDEAAAFAEGKYPVVLKILSETVLHKTEIGGVRAGITSLEELETEFALMEKRGMKVDGYRGILVEEMSPAGVEIIAGMQNDPAFGPVMMVGLGGVFTDLLKDVSFRPLPVNRETITAMLNELKGQAVLNGFRGSPPVDRELLADTLLALAKLGEDLAGVYESIDFNPVIATDRSCSVVDAKLVIPDKEIPDPFAFEKPRTDNMEKFFAPKRVAVIGASPTAGKIGNVILDSLVNLNFGGQAYPVNPNYSEIMGITAYPFLKELPEKPDLVIIVVALEGTLEILEQMNELGCKNAIIVSGGGKELGGDRADIEGTIAARARELGIRLIGPNCIGTFDGHSRFDSFFYPRERFSRPPAGPMGFITQSGTWGCAFMESAAVTGVSKMVSYGNRVDADEGDLVAFLGEDKNTSVIGSYIEGLGQGRKFLAAVDRAVQNKKPVVVFKTGRTEQSASAAVSHTGAYGGSYRVYEGAFRGGDVITTDSFHECYVSCETLALQPPAKGNRVALLSNGAGPMVNALDLFPDKGLAAAELTRNSVELMREKFSFFYIVENPVDVTGSATAKDYELVIETFFNDDNVDLVMPFFVFQNTPLDESIIDRLEKLHKRREKPIICCAAGGPVTDRMGERLRKVGVPVYTVVNQWVTAAAATVRWGEILQRRGFING